MAFFEFLSSVVSATLKFILWTATAMAGLVLVGLGLSVLLGWLLVNRLLGRPTRFSLAGFQNMRRFGAFMGRPVRRPAPEPTRRRRVPTGQVVDVQARDLPADRP